MTFETSHNSQQIPIPSTCYKYSKIQMPSLLHVLYTNPYFYGK